MSEERGSDSTQDNVAIVVGASSKIALALIDRLAADSTITKIIALSRQAQSPVTNATSGKILYKQCSYEPDEIESSCQGLANYKGFISRVYIFNGILHEKNLKPEKRIEDLKPENIQKLIQTNAVIPLMWVRHLKPILKGSPPCIVTVLSARIGSIDDNNRGGWYSYRASKAALNMMIKTAALEFNREIKNVEFLLFHPGTTDTPLSKPFQKFVDPDKLFTPSFVADQLMSLTAKPEQSEPVRFVAWDGKPIAW